jgi:hypothetical protein
MSPKLLSRRYNCKNAAQLNARQFPPTVVSTFSRFITHPQQSFRTILAFRTTPSSSRSRLSSKQSLLKFKSQVKHDYF